MLIRIDKIKDNPLVASYLNLNFNEFKKLIHDGKNINCITNKNNLLINSIVDNEANASNSLNLKFFMEILSAKPYLGKFDIDHCLVKSCIENGNECFLDCLLKSGVEISSNNYYWDVRNNMHASFYGNLIFGAMKAENVNITNLLLEHGIDCNQCNSHGDTLLTFSLKQSGNFFEKAIPLLIKHGAKIHKKDIQGMHPIHLLSKTNFFNEELFNYLIDDKKDIDIRNDYGSTALMIAVLHGDERACEILLKNGANINLQNEQGMTCAMIAANKRDYDMLDFLHKNNADMTIKEKYGCNLAHFISGVDLANYPYKYDQVISILKKYPDLLMVKNKENITPMDNIKKHLEKKDYQDLYNLATGGKRDVDQKSI